MSFFFFQDTQDIVTLLSKSPKNCVIALQQNLETTGDLFAALNQMHDVIVNIQGAVAFTSSTVILKFVTRHLSSEDKTKSFSYLFISGQTVGDQHWAHCSRFVFHTSCHLSSLLDRAGEKVFPHPEDLNLAKNTVNMMLKKAEALTSTHPVQRSDFCFIYTNLKKEKKKSFFFCSLYSWCRERSKSLSSAKKDFCFSNKYIK